MRELERLMEARSQVYKPPIQLVSCEIGLHFAIPLSPFESSSDQLPADWEERLERLGIDNFLGKYEERKRQITIFSRAIDFASDQMNVDRMKLEYIVRLHEWSHAAFHLAVTEEESFDVARWSVVEKNEEAIETYFVALTDAYHSAADYVHEQFAQALTYLVLKGLAQEAVLDEAKKDCEALQGIFRSLMRRQASRYKLDESLLSLDRAVLSNRLGLVVPLLRAGKVRGDRETWDKIISW